MGSEQRYYSPNQMIADVVKANGKIEFDTTKLMEGHAFLSPDQMGVQLHGASEMVDRAKQLMGYSAVSIQSECNAGISITGLGKERNDTDSQKAIQRRGLKMAKLFTGALDGDMEICVQCERADGQIDTKWLLKAEKYSAQTIAAMVSSVYGRVDFEPYEEQTADYQYRCYAKCGTIARSKEIIHKQNGDDPLPSWATAVMRAAGYTDGFQVSVKIHPLREAELEQLDAHIAELEDVYKALSFYGEVSINDGVNYAFSVNSSKSDVITSVLKSLSNLVKGAERVSVNNGSNYGLNSKQADKKIQSILEMLDFEILRLHEARNAGPCGLQISFGSKDEETLDILTNAMNATFEAANLSVEWSPFEETAFIGAGKWLYPFLMFPTNDFPGFHYVDEENFALAAPDKQESGARIGQILWEGKTVSDFGLPENMLNRHAFVCGMTGAGKTNTLFKIIELIQKPYLVIEPVKGEYRALRALYPDTMVWTLRTSAKQSSSVRLMQINPFWFPEHADIAFHIDSIKTILSSAFDLYAAMPNIVEQCLYNIYVKAGWDLVSNQNIYAGKIPDHYLYPTFSDLTYEIEEYLNQSDFGDETLGNYKGALLSRMKSFTNGTKGLLLNTREHPDYGQMQHGRNVIELEGLADDADKCLVMGTVLVQYYEYLKMHFDDKNRKNTLSHLFVIEEAHRLFKNTKSTVKQEGANPTGQLVDSLSNIMAEIRAFGEGMVIVDQSPSKISGDVIKNSCTKIIHRIDNAEDIELLRSALLLPEKDMSLPILCRGEMLIRTDGMRKACKVLVDRADKKEEYSLADSFASGNAANDQLRDAFSAISILQNPLVYERLKKQVRRLLLSMVVMDWAEWYDVVDRFLVQVNMCLMENRVEQYFGYRLSGLFEVVSQTVLRYCAQMTRLQLGTAHSCVMRLLELYAEERRGEKVKPAKWKLMGRFVEKNFSIELFWQEADAASQGTLEHFYDALKVTQDSPVVVALMELADDIAEELSAMDEKKSLNSEQLRNIFFDVDTFLAPREDLVDDVLFERTAAIINQRAASEAQ